MSTHPNPPESPKTGYRRKTKHKQAVRRKPTSHPADHEDHFDSAGHNQFDEYRHPFTSPVRNHATTDEDTEGSQRSTPSRDREPDYSDYGGSSSFGLEESFVGNEGLVEPSQVRYSCPSPPEPVPTTTAKKFSQLMTPEERYEVGEKAMKVLEELSGNDLSSLIDFIMNNMVTIKDEEAPKGSSLFAKSLDQEVKNEPSETPHLGDEAMSPLPSTSAEASFYPKLPSEEIASLLEEEEKPLLNADTRDDILENRCSFSDVSISPLASPNRPNVDKHQDTSYDQYSFVDLAPSPFASPKKTVEVETPRTGFSSKRRAHKTKPPKRISKRSRPEEEEAADDESPVGSKLLLPKRNLFPCILTNVKHEPSSKDHDEEERELPDLEDPELIVLSSDSDDDLPSCSGFKAENVIKANTIENNPHITIISSDEEYDDSSRMSPSILGNVCTGSRRASVQDDLDPPLEPKVIITLDQSDILTDLEDHEEDEEKVDLPASSRTGTGADKDENEDPLVIGLREKLAEFSDTNVDIWPNLVLFGSSDAKAECPCGLSKCCKSSGSWEFRSLLTCSSVTFGQKCMLDYTKIEGHSEHNLAHFLYKGLHVGIAMTFLKETSDSYVFQLGQSWSQCLSKPDSKDRFKLPVDVRKARPEICFSKENIQFSNPKEKYRVKFRGNFKSYRRRSICDNILCYMETAHKKVG